MGFRRCPLPSEANIEGSTKMAVLGEFWDHRCSMSWGYHSPFSDWQDREPWPEKMNRNHQRLFLWLLRRGERWVCFLPTDHAQGADFPHQKALAEGWDCLQVALQHGPGRQGASYWSFDTALITLGLRKTVTSYRLPRPRGFSLDFRSLRYARGLAGCSRLVVHPTSCVASSASPWWLCRAVHELEVLKSPGWHRRLRAKRSQARLTIKQHRALHPASTPTPRVLAAIKLLEKHHSAPLYKETMYNKGWSKQTQWDAWSPQWPKGGPKQNKKNQEKPKDKQPQGVLSAYDTFAGGSSQSASSSGGQDSQLFKEFLSYMKENRGEMPENIQRLIPEDNKESIREAFPLVPVFHWNRHPDFCGGDCLDHFDLRWEGEIHCKDWQASILSQSPFPIRWLEAENKELTFHLSSLSATLWCELLTGRLPGKRRLPWGRHSTTAWWTLGFGRSLFYDQAGDLAREVWGSSWRNKEPWGFGWRFWPKWRWWCTGYGRGRLLPDGYHFSNWPATYYPQAVVGWLLGNA